MGCALTTGDRRATHDIDEATEERPSLVNTHLMTTGDASSTGSRRRAHRKQRIVKAVSAPATDVDKHGSGLTRGREGDPRVSLTTGMPTVNGRGLTSGWGMINGTGMTREPGFHRDAGRVNGSGQLMTSSLASSEGMTNGSGLTRTGGIAAGGGMTNGTGLTRGEGLTNGHGLVKGPGTYVPPPEAGARTRRGLLGSILHWGGT
jgi:hypothetical protein